MHSRIRLLIIPLLCLIHVVLSAQPVQQPLKKWIKTLSVKDPRGQRMNAVVNEILATDSSTWCQTINRPTESYLLNYTHDYAGCIEKGLNATISPQQ